MRHNATSPDTLVPPDEFFRSLEERRTRALVERDSATLEELHAAAYQLITPTGRALSREAYLNAVKAEPFYAGWEVGAMSFRTSAQMAVIRYKARLHFPSGRELVCWHTDSYERGAHGWQAIWSQATEIPPASSSAVGNIGSTGAPFCAIYRWRLHPGSEEIFVGAWSRITRLLLTERGSLGSRLHRGPDNTWYSYTQWPSAGAKAAGLAHPSVDPEAWQQLRDAIAESLPELVIEPVSDFLIPLRQDGA